MARVLLVDDDAPGLEIRKLILESKGYVVETAACAEAALSIIGRSPPDCILLDLLLPDAATGRGLVRELRQALPGARIVVLTGQPSGIEQHPERSLVDQVLEKPVRSERLLAAIGPVGR